MPSVPGDVADAIRSRIMIWYFAVCIGKTPENYWPSYGAG